MKNESSERWLSRKSVGLVIRWSIDRRFRVHVSVLLNFTIFLLFFYFLLQTDKTHYSVKNCGFLSFLGGIRGFFILTRDLEKIRKFFSLVLGKIREVSLPFVVDGSDIALWRISTGRRHHLLYYSALRAVRHLF